MCDANRGAITRGPSRRPTDRARLLGLAMAAVVWSAVAPPVALAQNSYSDYYRRNLRQTGGGVGTGNSNRYLYDKYFYRNTAVSPYMSMARPGAYGSTSYFTYVRPELERRERNLKSQAAYIQQRKLQGNVGETRYPGTGFIGSSPSDAIMKPAPKRAAAPAYYNHWYGSWSNR